MSSNSTRATSPNSGEREGASSSLNYPIVTVTTPSMDNIREGKKKKVGFAGDPSPPKEREDDYFSHAPSGSGSAGNTPGVEADPTARRDSFDRAELTEALEKILKPEDHSGPAELHLPRPRPALRKNSKPASPTEPILGLSHPSEIEARNRAGRLAESVSGLASRRTSVDHDDDQFALLDGVSAQDWHEKTAERLSAASGVAQPDEADAEGLTYRKKVETEADRLVRQHTQRRREGVIGPRSRPQTPDPGFRSGAATPVAYDDEYVPPAPATYHGGILGSLLKLYGNEHRLSSGATTPDGRTPNRTPDRTPRNSPPTTAPGTPRGSDLPPSRPRSGLFGLGARHSASTLAELIGSSSTLAAPATSGTGKDLSDIVANKVKSDREKPKKDHKRKGSKSSTKAQQILVTKQ